MEKLTAQQVIQMAGLNDDSFYMHTDTGSVDTGRGWKETILGADPDDMCFLDGDPHLIEVKNENGKWVEA